MYPKYNMCVKLKNAVGMYHLVTPGGFCPAKTSPGLGRQSLHLRPGFSKNHVAVIRRLYVISGVGAVGTMPFGCSSREPLGLDHGFDLNFDLRTCSRTVSGLGKGKGWLQLRADDLRYPSGKLLPR